MLLANRVDYHYFKLSHYFDIVVKSLVHNSGVGKKIRRCNKNGQNTRKWENFLKLKKKW